jgi:1-acyl-sn-glycerol-3-phosphate acyltransferase
MRQSASSLPTGAHPLSETPNLVIFDSATSRPDAFRGALSEMFRYACIAYLKLSGWRIAGDWPAITKAVLVAAPHTSNWDGVNMLAAAGYYRVKLHWMGKKSLTTGPFGWLIRWLGCVPVDRSARSDLVRSMSSALDARSHMILAVPPEGTRSLTTEWKSGFYHIAQRANVPILLTVLDYGTRTISVRGLLTPTGDYAADLSVIRAQYRTARGLRAHQSSVA